MTGDDEAAATKTKHRMTAAANIITKIALGHSKQVPPG